MPRSSTTGDPVAAARAVSERHMPETATVERWSDGTFDPDDPGGTGEGWNQVGETTKGRVDLAGDRASDRQVAAMHDLAEVIAAVLPSGTEVAQKDKVTVGTVSLIVRAVQRPTYDADTRVIGESP